MYNLAQIAVFVATLGTAFAKTPKGGALDPDFSHRTVQPDSPNFGPSRAITLHVTNKFGKALKAVVVTAAGSPSVGHDGTVPVGGGWSTTFPQHSAGQVTLGLNTNPLGSKIEISNGFNPRNITDPFVDVSFVDGFSVPIVCTCPGHTTGCSKPLFKIGTCPRSQTEAGPLCVNTVNPNGPPEPFFAPCRNFAYVFDNQPQPGTGNYCSGNTINCCVGSACSGGKREVAQDMAERRGLDA